MSTDQSPGEAGVPSFTYDWTPEPTETLLWDTDLDQPAPPRAPRPPRDRSGVTRAAVVLAVLAVGALAGALIAPPAPPRPPPSVTMAVQDAYLDGGPVLAVRLTIANVGDERARLTGLVVEGAGSRRLLEPLDVTVAPNGSAVADVKLNPQCSGRDQRTRAHVIAPSEPSGSIPVSLTRGLDALNGFCAALDTRLPSGWPTVRPALGTRIEGQDLVITVADLSADRLDGIEVDHKLLPNVFVSDHFITSSAVLRPGENSEVRLHGPPPCIVTNTGDPAPTTMRLLAHGEETLVQRLIAVGPELTRWVRSTCDRG